MNTYLIDPAAQSMRRVGRLMLMGGVAGLVTAAILALRGATPPGLEDSTVCVSASDAVIRKRVGGLRQIDSTFPLQPNCWSGWITVPEHVPWTLNWTSGDLDLWFATNERWRLQRGRPYRLENRHVFRARGVEQLRIEAAARIVPTTGKPREKLYTVPAAPQWSPEISISGHVWYNTEGDATIRFNGERNVDVRHEIAYELEADTTFIQVQSRTGEEMKIALAGKTSIMSGKPAGMIYTAPVGRYSDWVECTRGTMIRPEGPIKIRTYEGVEMDDNDSTQKPDLAATRFVQFQSNTDAAIKVRVSR